MGKVENRPAAVGAGGAQAHLERQPDAAQRVRNLRLHRLLRYALQWAAPSVCCYVQPVRWRCLKQRQGLAGKSCKQTTVHGRHGRVGGGSP